VHELSLAGAVIDTAERHAGGRRVVLIQLRLGELRQVVPESLAFYFEHVARGTLCEGAKLEYEIVPGRLACAECSAGWALDDAGFRCPHCGAANAAVESGNEFEVESIEVEEPACTG
jgi:hydrogenase nickel incorporation protein HypA/HybF